MYSFHLTRYSPGLDKESHSPAKRQEHFLAIMISMKTLGAAGYGVDGHAVSISYLAGNTTDLNDDAYQLLEKVREYAV